MINKNRKCNHDINSEENTLIIVSKRVMIHPNKLDCFCPICKKIFKFIQNDEHIYELLD